MSTGSGAGDPEAPTAGRQPFVLDGIAGSPGLAIGHAVVVDTRRPGIPRRHVEKQAIEEELVRFDAAVRATSQALRGVAAQMRTGTAHAQSSILEAYVAMVEDASLRRAVEQHVTADLQCAEWALDSAVSRMADQLRAAGDPYLADRSQDFEFVGEHILRAMTGRQRPFPLIATPEGMPILVAHNLSPAEAAGLSKDRVKAIVTEVGTRTSHTAIVARALEIPAVVGARGITSQVATGELLVVDGLRGKIMVSPTAAMIDAARERAERHQARTLGLLGAKDRPASTRCGTPIAIRANIELPAEATLALEHGAQGIGLYRTEFLYLARTTPPTEDEQLDVYRGVLEVMAPRPVTLRTFDLGGDKLPLTARTPSEPNPALGVRAVRLGLSRPELMLTQLRAMVRASAYGKLRIMVPMISTLGELRAVRHLLLRAMRQVDESGFRRDSHLSLGVLIEIPSAALMADEFAAEADFLSIGTNDLVQYTLAVDRANGELAHLASAFQPGVLRLIRAVIQGASRHDRPVSLCGAMSSDPLGAALLIGMGLRELSMEPIAIPEVKSALSRITVAEAELAARRVLECVTVEEVNDVLLDAFAARFGDLLDLEGN
jgi:phosphoenolpyruvate-protein phosphotransferase (PTS system enzyme I)